MFFLKCRCNAHVHFWLKFFQIASILPLFKLFKVADLLSHVKRKLKQKGTLLAGRLRKQLVKWLIWIQLQDSPHGPEPRALSSTVDTLKAKVIWGKVRSEEWTFGRSGMWDAKFWHKLSKYVTSKLLMPTRGWHKTSLHVDREVSCFFQRADVL